MTRVPCRPPFVAAALVAVLACACGGPPGAPPVAFDDREVTRSADGCEPGAEGCAWARIRWLETTAGPGSTRGAIDEWIRTRTLEPLADDWVVETPADVAEALLADRARFVADFPDAASAGWFLEREIRRLPAPDGLVSLEFVERQYTGGAHGIESLRLATFRESDGALLGLDDLVPTDRRAAFAERLDAAFRAARGLGPDADLREAGFALEGGRLPPTDNVARVSDGVRVRYDAYEIGSYALGPTDLTVAP